MEEVMESGGNPICNLYRKERNPSAFSDQSPSSTTPFNFNFKLPKSEKPRSGMVRASTKLLAQTSLSKTLFEILVCPLSKQPLRVCEETGSLISDAIGVSFPIKDGIPQLVPKDGKILDNDDEIDAPKPNAADDSSSMNKTS